MGERGGEEVGEGGVQDLKRWYFVSLRSYADDELVGGCNETHSFQASTCARLQA